MAQFTHKTTGLRSGGAPLKKTAKKTETPAPLTKGPKSDAPVKKGPKSDAPVKKGPKSDAPVKKGTKSDAPAPLTKEKAVKIEAAAPLKQGPKKSSEAAGAASAPASRVFVKFVKSDGSPVGKSGKSAKAEGAPAPLKEKTDREAAPTTKKGPKAAKPAKGSGPPATSKMRKAEKMEKETKEEDATPSTVADPTAISKFVPNGDVAGLQRLNIVGRNFHDIRDAEQLKNCTDVDMGKNKFTSLGGFAKNFELRHLRAADNLIEKVRNNDLRNLGNLIILDLSGNQLTTLIMDLDMKLPTLKTLLVSRNEIEKLDRLDRFPALQTLIASHNKIRSVDEPKKPLKDLSKLSLPHNKLPQLPNCAKFPALKELRCNSNQLLMDDPPVNSLASLQILDVGHNPGIVWGPTKAKLLPAVPALKNLNISSADWPAEEAKALERLAKNTTKIEILNGRRLAKKN